MQEFRILTVENGVYDLTTIPTIIEHDLRYAVLDYSNEDDVDFVFPPVVFLDQFDRAAAVLTVGKHTVRVPHDWSILIADATSGDLEVIPVAEVQGRGFQAFSLNPISGYMPTFLPIDTARILPSVSWTVPKTSTGHFLALPLDDSASPLCVFFIRDTKRLPASLEISQIMS